MVISTKKYEESHGGKKPGGFAQAWHFEVRGGKRTETLKFENVEYSKAVSLLRQMARTRLLGATHAEVLG